MSSWNQCWTSLSKDGECSSECQSSISISTKQHMTKASVMPVIERYHNSKTSKCKSDMTLTRF